MVHQVCTIFFYTHARTWKFSGFAGCSLDDEVETSGTASKSEKGKDGSWAIYWYLCGSDLESQNGFATTDLAEATGVELPDNVTLVVQTGGACR